MNRKKIEAQDPNIIETKPFRALSPEMEKLRQESLKERSRDLSHEAFEKRNKEVKRKKTPIKPIEIIDIQKVSLMPEEEAKEFDPEEDIGMYSPSPFNNEEDQIVPKDQKHPQTKQKTPRITDDYFQSQKLRNVQPIKFT